ncbi:phage repressor protein C with HTH and peptisase S24 domain [Sphingobacterium yanglingense]|uniref:Phage repressor protein C with HTH and peptisase S24 domain n=2 Tax=Sphingobacterium yanglingense TaxID=1437280 RepID=A0A4R6WHB8_9SPHI|nr:phage repressor protein C with HTH and peptisase S24 domain [Sphingobacterium yanglingense]
MTDIQQNNIRERLIELRKEHLKLNQRMFGQPIKYTQSAISEIEKGNNNITSKFLISLSNYYKVRMEWLENGELPIFKLQNDVNAQSISEIFQVDEDISHNKFIDIGNGTMLMLTPLVDEYAYAGYLSGYKDPEYIEELPTHPIFVNKYHKGNYQSFVAVGDSMTTTNQDLIEDNIYHGNIVTGREIIRPHWLSHLHTHAFRDYVIVHREGILIKRILKHNVEEGILTIHSLNENKDLYPDREISLDDVYQIFSIVEVHQKRKK